MVKTCSKCNIEKDKSCFQKDIGKKDGLCHYCKVCCKIRRRIWYENNKIVHKKNTNEYRINNKEKHNALSVSWQKRNFNKYKATQKIQNARGASELKDWYVKQILWHKGYTRKELEGAPELIEAMRIILKIKRHVKEKTGKKHSGT